MEQRENGMEVYSGNVSDRGCDSHAHPDHAIDSGTDIWGAVESGIFGDLADFSFMDDSDSEKGLDRPLASGEPSEVTALDHISYRRKGRVGSGKQIADEFEEPKRTAFLMLYDRIRACYVDAASSKHRKECLDWVFTPEPDRQQITFRLCCRVLGVRSWLLRVRIHFQFFKKGVVFAEPMSFMTVPVPSLISSETLYATNEAGLRLVSRAWMQPGMIMAELAPSKEEARMLWQLEEKGIVGEHGDRWYVTGRNPYRKGIPKETVWWSSMWPANFSDDSDDGDEQILRAIRQAKY
jgi:hypothetical protein